MAAIPIPEEVKQKVIAEHRTGKYSIRELAARNGISRSKAGELVMGIEKDSESIVDAGVQYKQGLAQHGGQMADAIADAVDERMRHIRLFNSLAANNAIKASRLPCETHQDHERLSNTILRSKEVVLGKSPETAVQINNNNPEQAQTVAQFEESARRLLTEI